MHYRNIHDHAGGSTKLVFASCYNLKIGADSQTDGNGSMWSGSSADARIDMASARNHVGVKPALQHHSTTAASYCFGVNFWNPLREDNIKFTSLRSTLLSLFRYKILCATFL
jgi:hypothetical protein